MSSEAAETLQERAEDSSASASRRRATAVGALLLVAVLSALFFYKWGGSLRTLQRVNESGKLGIATDALVDAGVWKSTAYYFQRIWPALVYGILVGAVVRSTMSPRWIAAALGRRGAKPTLAAAACGSPLMLCSCCVTPIFTGVYERGARLGPALSLVLASPGLNVAALVLTFTLMPMRFGLIRLAAALVIVFALAPAIGRLHDAAPRRLAPATEDDAPVTWSSILQRFARSLVYMTLVTVPLIVVGVVLSAWLLPRAVHLPAYASAITVIAVALAATLIALPTFFEIPIAFLLLQLGAPEGAAVALLVAGPVVNLPSLFVLGRETNARVAASLAVGVWIVACLAGLATLF